MSSSGRAFWLSPEEVAEEYVARGRPEDALEVQRREFARRPEVPRFRALAELAERVGSLDAERARAFATLDELARQPFGSGAARIRIALAEGDIETAWEVAGDFGPGDAWQELAGALAAEFPGRAATLHQPRVDKQLAVANSSKYAEIADNLELLRDLCDRAGESEDFAAYLQGIRIRYARRPALMGQLDRRGL
nr:hypothetical protein [Nocardioides sp. InS609-2]